MGQWSNVVLRAIGTLHDHIETISTVESIKFDEFLYFLCSVLCKEKPKLWVVRRERFDCVKVW